THASLLNRFWTGTALTPGIALGIASAWSAARALDRPTRGAWLRTLALLLSLLAIHPAYGIFAASAVAVGLGNATRGERRGAAWAQLAACALAMVAGLVWSRLCSPPGTTPDMRIGLYRPNLWSLLIAIGPWWLIAAPAFRAVRRGSVATRFVAEGALFAVLASLFVVLPQLNTEKLFYLAWLSLVPFIAAGFVMWADRMRLPAIARVAVLAA